MTNCYTLPDTRPYPTDPVKNELLLYAGQIAQSSSIAQRKLAQESLAAGIYTMLQQKPLSGFVGGHEHGARHRCLSTFYSTASMALCRPKPMKKCNGLRCRRCWWPAENRRKAAQPMRPLLRAGRLLRRVSGLAPARAGRLAAQVVHAQDSAAVNAWPMVCRRSKAAKPPQLFAATLPQADLAFPEGQSVQVVFALGYGGKALHKQLFSL